MAHGQTVLGFSEITFAYLLIEEYELIFPVLVEIGSSVILPSIVIVIFPYIQYHCIEFAHLYAVIKAFIFASYKAVELI